MSIQECNESEYLVARKYRIIRVDDTGFALEMKNDPVQKLNLHQSYILLRFATEFKSVVWHTDDTGKSHQIINLVVRSLQIGFSAEEGWSSPLVNNSLFIADGETLRYVPLTTIRVMSEGQYYEEERLINIALQAGVQPETNRSQCVGPARLTHMPEQFSRWIRCDESFDCSIGLPINIFDQLLVSCQSGRSDSFCFTGSGSGLSASFEYGSARDIIIPVEGKFDFNISDVDIESSYKSKPRSESEKKAVEISDKESDVEKILPVFHQLTIGIERFRYTVIKVSLILAVVLLIAVVIK
jgi:hypothetical protein